MSGAPEGVSEGSEPVEIPITGELDLHTFASRETSAVLDAYFDACLAKKIYRVRVVHGKGIGTLRETVHVHLRRHPAVVSFHLADERSGSWGATWVTLRASA